MFSFVYSQPTSGSSKINKIRFRIILFPWKTEFRILLVCDNCCWQVIDHIDIWSLWWYITGFLPTCVYVGTTVWQHYLGFNENQGEKLDGNYTWMLHAILNNFWKQNSTKQYLYGHLPPILQTILVRWIRHTEKCLWRKDELISDVLLWTPTHGHTSVGRPAWTPVLCGHKLQLREPARSDGR